jgi:glyoxylase-like metal-dependent hydrolase (beta-lactamase superfamily II)
MDSSHRLNLPAGVSFLQRGWLQSNTLVVREPEGFSLVDTGYHTGLQALVAALREELGLDVRRLRRILNTHSHPDHCGGNGALQALSGCEVWMSDIDALLVASGDPVGLMWGYVQMDCPAFRVTRTLVPGEHVDVGGLDFEVVDGSGHASGEVSYHCAEARLLVCGDLLWKEGFSNVIPLTEGAGGLARHERALSRLQRLPLELALPGHGPAIVGREAIQASIARTLERLRLFRSQPQRWVEAALKAFVTMRLLEQGAVERQAFVRTCLESQWYREHQARFLASHPPRLEALLEDLMRRGVIREDVNGMLSTTLPA